MVTIRNTFFHKTHKNIGNTLAFDGVSRAGCVLSKT